MKTINFVFSTTDRLSSKFLRWAQRCEHSHVEICFGDYTIGARSTGVEAYTDFSMMTKRKSRTLEVTDVKYRKFYDFMHSKIGADYDWRAYLGFVAYKNNHNANKYVCSELIQEALVHAGIEVVINTAPHFCQPRDFWISPVLQEKKL